MRPSFLAFLSTVSILISDFKLSLTIFSPRYIDLVNIFFAEMFD